MGIPFIIGASQQKKKRILGFEAFVAPDDFDRKAQPVDIYDVFERYYRNHGTAKHIYSFTSNIATLTLGAVSGVSYRWGETIGGIDYTYDIESGTAFTAGSTKRYVIVLSTAASMNCPLPLGAVWAYKTTFGYFASEGNTYLNYLHADNLSNIKTNEGLLRNNGLIGTVTIPQNPTNGIIGPTIGRWFYGCTGLTKVVLSSGLRTINGRSFQNCTGITEVEWVEGVEDIGSSAFDGCTGLSGDLTLPDSVKYIRVSAFSNCSNLNGELTLGSGTIIIGGTAFLKCRFTGTLTIPSNVTTIGGGSFGNCDFTAFDVTANSGYEVDDYIMYEIGTKTALHSIKSYTGSLTIKNDTVIIGAYCFYNGNTRSGNLTIPNSVTTIDASAFQNCTMTGTIALSNTLASLGSSAFYGSSFSGNLVLPDSITVITAYSFASMVNMTGTLTLGNAVTQIDGYAFDQNNFTGSLTIPSTCNSIGARCFRGGNFNGALTINSPNISINTTAAIQGAFTDLWLCASYSSAYLLFNFSNNFSAISLDSSLKNITDGTSLAWKTFTIGATNKARLLAAYPNAETDANARYIYVV